MADSDPSDKEATRINQGVKRHLNRSLSFDLNRSSSQVWEKYTRNNQSERMPARPPQIEDKSATINVPTASQGAVPKQRPLVHSGGRNMQQEEEIPSAVRIMVTESVGEMRANIDRAMERIITDKLNRELNKVNENMAHLAEMVKSLATAGRTNQPSTESEYRFDQQGLNRNNYFPSQPQSSGVNIDTWRIRVDKLGIEFNGSQGQLSVEEFVFRLEHMQRQYQIPWEEILRDFHLLVSGPVKQWYWALLQTTRISDWNTLRIALLNRYKAVRSNWELMHDLVERKQLPGESIDEFFHNLNILRAGLEVPVAEGEMIRIAKRNLKDSLSRIVYPMSVSSVEQLGMECLQAERTFSKKEYRSVPQAVRPIRTVNEAVLVEAENEEEAYSEVAEIDSQPICWNCQQKGHYFKECTSTKRTLFCYKCGKPNTITPNCQKCQAKGNSRRGAISSGESRPSGNAPKSL